MKEVKTHIEVSRVRKNNCISYWVKDDPDEIFIHIKKLHGGKDIIFFVVDISDVCAWKIDNITNISFTTTEIGGKRKDIAIAIATHFFETKDYITV